MKKIIIAICFAIVCGCNSRHDKELLLIQNWARPIAHEAHAEAIVSGSVDIPSGYPQSASRCAFGLKFNDSNEYLDWLWKDPRIREIMDSKLPQNPFCVVLDLPIYPWVANRWLPEETLVKIPFLFTRNLEITVTNGLPVCTLTKDWPFGKKGVFVYTYRGEQHFIPADEVQAYFESIPFTNAFLRP